MTSFSRQGQTNAVLCSTSYKTQVDISQELSLGIITPITLISFANIIFKNMRLCTKGDGKQFAVSLSYLFSNCFDVLVERFDIKCIANYMIINTLSDKKHSGKSDTI